MVAGAGCGHALKIASLGNTDFNNPQLTPKTIAVQLSIPGGIGSYAAGAYTGTLNVLLYVS
jgi:hypothetical protein